MKILVAITNYGTTNDGYLRVLLDEYRSMSYEVHVLVLSNVRKTFEPGVETILEVPKGNPWSFTFAHKKYLAERLHEFDLFIHSEDDILITERNIAAFLEVTKVLPENELAGFFRSERCPDGSISFSTVHAHFHWDPRSVVARGPYTFAYFNNEQSASYMLTRSQLSRAIASGGYLVRPHQGRYFLAETAATDPYTQCGFKKMVCVSHISDFALPHLPNKYVGTLGIGEDEFFQQLEAIQAIKNKTRPCTVLLNGETRLWQCKWSKQYDEPLRPDVMTLIPERARSVLSYGCGRGEMEGALARKGLHVTAIAMDSISGICAERKGVHVIYGSSEAALSQLSDQRFDCVLVSNVLHLLPDPSRLLSSLAKLLNTDGVMVVTAPNLSNLSVLWRRIRRAYGYTMLSSYERIGTHFTSSRMLLRWLRRSNLRAKTMVPIIAPWGKRAYRTLGNRLADLFAEEFLLTADKSDCS